VTRRFFETLDVPLVRGRGFTASETEQGSTVAVVNVSFVRRVIAASDASRKAPSDKALLGASDLGGVDPIGRRIKVPGLDGAPWLTIVGVVPDFLTTEMDDNTDASPAVFVAYRQRETPNTGIIVRAAGDPASLTSALRAAVREADPGVPVFAVATMDEVRRKGFWAFELFSWMFGIFGGLALVLGSAGVYGVLSYAVSQRTQELGIRIALGASTRDVLALTVGHGLKLVAAGVVAGVAGAAAVTRFIGTLLYDVTPTDPISFAVVIGVLGGVGLLASYLPARRAMRIDPVAALRSE
jgi:putative ABC transport system permease protein